MKLAYIRTLFTGRAASPEECVSLTAKALGLPVWAVKTILWREPIPNDVLDAGEISFTEISEALERIGD